MLKKYVVGQIYYQSQEVVVMAWKIKALVTSWAESRGTC